MRPLRLGTRRSPLAMAQAGLVARAVTATTGRPVELVPVTTVGDSDQRTPLSLLGGTGVFATALRQALCEGRVDLAVHSYKDLPTAPFAGLTIAAVPDREDVRDALVSRHGLALADLPGGARVGTGSPRRAAQIGMLRPDVRVTGLRGNLDTRLARVTAGELHAVVLACAGMRRLGRARMISEAFDVDVLLPAPAQGALAVEARIDDSAAAAAAATIDNASARAAVDAERRLLVRLEAGCSAPVGATARVDAGRLTLTGAVFALDGSGQIRGTATGTVADPFAIADRLADDLFRRGAAALLSLGPAVRAGTGAS